MMMCLTFQCFQSFKWVQSVAFCLFLKFLDAGIQDISTNISIVDKLIEMSHQDDGDDSVTYVEARDLR